MKYSVIIPVYKNEGSIPRLVAELELLAQSLNGQLEVVFVVDGSPDSSYTMLQEVLKTADFPLQLLAHSRNFGSMAAVRSGLQAASGEYFAIMAADLQEPPKLMAEFFKSLEADECDVAIGTRDGRRDPLFTRVTAKIFWSCYRRLIVKDMPKGGVDVFGCNRVFRDQLLSLEESRSSLVALIFWLGFRRKLFSYERQLRQEGVSAWSFSRKVDYMMDSIFAFTDYPIRILTRIGAIGSVLSISLGLIIVIARVIGVIDVPGYAATMLVVLVLGALNLLGLGLVGTYAWRGYENTKRRPSAIVMLKEKNKYSDGY